MYEDEQEIKDALYWALDEVNRQNKERVLKQQEALNRERERKTREGLPLVYDCYFAKFTSGMHIRDEDLRDLWETDRVAIHLKSKGDPESPRSEELDPKNYSGYEGSMIRHLLHLSEKGGYVWFENRSGRRANVGVVKPGTQIESIDARWSETVYGKHKEKAGTTTRLQTLRLEKVHAVHLIEATTVRASRPVVHDHTELSLRRWEPACGTDRLISMIDQHGTATPETKWNALPPDLQSTVCTDFLRYNDNPNYPNLRHLLLPSTMSGKEVDNYGLAEDGTEILVQAPFANIRAKEGFEVLKKSKRLQRYSELDATLICFISDFGDDEGIAGQEKLFQDSSPTVKDGVTLIPVTEVLRWVEEQPAYADSLFSA